MDKKRMGEIALKMIKYQAKKDRVNLNLKLVTPNQLKELGTTRKELKEFAKILVNEIIDEQ